MPEARDRMDVPVTHAGKDSFAEFAMNSLPALLRFGHVLTGSPQEAEELVQEALASCLRRWRRQAADDPVAYVRRVMVNAHVTRWRRWGSRVRLESVPETEADDAGLRRCEDWDELRQALRRLPSGQRAVLVLRYLEDLPDASIATMLGCSANTVRSQASRGLAALRPMLAGAPHQAGRGGAYGD